MTTDPMWTSDKLLDGLAAGDAAAADATFSRYVERLTRLARTRLSHKLASRLDPDDVVASAWRSFFVRAGAGHFALRRSGDLWRLLAAMTLHKLYRQVRHHSAERRSVDKEQSIDALADLAGPFDREPTADEALALSDEVESLMMQIDPFHRRVLELRLQGEPISEIAGATGRAERSVRRALQAIRELLTRKRVSQFDERL